MFWKLENTSHLDSVQNIREITNFFKIIIQYHFCCHFFFHHVYFATNIYKFLYIENVSVTIAIMCQYKWMMKSYLIPHIHVVRSDQIEFTRQCMLLCANRSATCWYNTWGHMFIQPTNKQRIQYCYLYLRSHCAMIWNAELSLQEGIIFDSSEWGTTIIKEMNWSLYQLFIIIICKYTGCA